MKCKSSVAVLHISKYLYVLAGVGAGPLICSWRGEVFYIISLFSTHTTPRHAPARDYRQYLPLLPPAVFLSGALRHTKICIERGEMPQQIKYATIKSYLFP